jgi:hypothetical protein
MRQVILAAVLVVLGGALVVGYTGYRVVRAFGGSFSVLDDFRGSTVRGTGTPETIGPHTYQASSITVRHALAVLRVSPEDRGDVMVQITNPGRLATPTMTMDGSQLVIDGGVRDWDVRDCTNRGDTVSARVSGIVEVSSDEVPVITVRTPRAVRLSAGSAVRSLISNASSADLHLAGCGETTIGNVDGPLSLALAGSGNASAGRAEQAALKISGSGDLQVGAVEHDVHASIAGSGSIDVGSMAGALTSHIAGSGDIKVHGGTVSNADVSIAGSGGVDVNAPVEDVDAHISGSGDVRVASVSGAVHKHIAGSGEVRVGN